MSHGAAHTERLRVQFAGQWLDRPHIVEVQLSNVGNKDLEPQHFNGLPLEILSTARVVSLLQESSEPSTQRTLQATVEPGGFVLSPVTPFHKGQTLNYVALVDGASPEVALRASISNTAIDRQDAPTLVTLPMRTPPQWVAILGVVAIVGNVVLSTGALVLVVR
jgi:hypothetical protein